MAVIFDLCKELQKKDLQRIIGQMDDAQDKASIIIDEYYNLMIKDSSLAIDELGKFVYKMRNVYGEGSSGYEVFVGGPNHDNIAPLFNVLGWAYPHINKESKIKGLKYLMNYFNGLRCDYSRNHVELIDEPHLASDVVCTNFLYWPGYEIYIDQFAKHDTWKEFSESNPNIKSRFWLTMTVLRPKYTSLDIRKNFYEEFPALVDRTLDAIAAIAHTVAKSAEINHNEKYDEILNTEINKHDPLHHKSIRAKVDEKKWIRLDRMGNEIVDELNS